MGKHILALACGTVFASYIWNGRAGRASGAMYFADQLDLRNKKNCSICLRFWPYDSTTSSFLIVI